MLETSLLFNLWLQEKGQPSASSWAPVAPVLDLRIRGWMDAQLHLMVRGLDGWSRELGFVPSYAFWMTTGISAHLSVPRFPQLWNSSFSFEKALGMLLKKQSQEQMSFFFFKKKTQPEMQYKKEHEAFLRPNREGYTGWLGFSSEVRDVIQFPSRDARCHTWGCTVPPSPQLPLQNGISFLKILCLIYPCCLDVSGKPEHLNRL